MAATGIEPAKRLVFDIANAVFRPVQVTLFRSLISNRTPDRKKHARRTRTEDHGEDDHKRIATDMKGRA